MCTPTSWHRTGDAWRHSTPASWVAHRCRRNVISRGSGWERATGLAGARIDGVHLRLPGFGDGGPTLEVLQYGISAEGPAPVPNRLGLGHLAFAVDDVATALEEVLAAGGSAAGEIVTLPVAGAGHVTFVYARDSEGNILELQHWGDDATTPHE